MDKSLVTLIRKMGKTMECAYKRCTRHCEKVVESIICNMLTELEVKNAGMPQETLDFKDIDMRLWWLLIACTKGEANNYVCNPEDQDSQRGNKWSVTLIRGHTFSEPRVG